MGKRRAARELALSWLFQVDVGKASPEEALESSTDSRRFEEETLNFARKLFLTAVNNLGEIDQKLSQFARNWPLDRMASVDRNVLRLAACEILLMPDIPHGASVDEAVELAKKFSTEESGKFVNGVLGNLVRSLEAEAPAEEQSEGAAGDGADV